MKQTLCTALVIGFLVGATQAQAAGTKSGSNNATQTVSPAKNTNQAPEFEEIQQLRSDVQRLKILLNQMWTNLAFVQATQSPLKHQFELEADAWQVTIEQMERRLKRMEQGTQFVTRGPLI
jgi:hypothetical protein